MQNSTQTQSPLCVEARDLTKTYSRGTETVHALQSVSFTIQKGEFVAIVGPSGAGKTTLLHMLGCMDVPTSGAVVLNGKSTAGLSDSVLTRLRREEVGFVFQHFGLLPTLTVRENIALPTLFSRRNALQRTDMLLEKVGLVARRNHRPHQLSGGEMQRVAIARALINTPNLLLADEPTGNLDTSNGQAIMELFHQLNTEGLTVIIVTHNLAFAEEADRLITLRDGQLEADTSRFDLLHKEPLAKRVSHGGTLS